MSAGLWSEAQRQAIETLDQDLCVDAAAGSGKTSVLIERIMHILDGRQATLDEIVAITFTEAAAGEMRERLRKACKSRESIHDADQMSFWRETGRKVEYSRISTIHAFCGGILRRYALTAGIPPDFDTITEIDADLVREECISDVIPIMLAESNEQALRAASTLGLARLVSLVNKLLDDAVMLHGSRLLDSSNPARLQEAWVQLTAREYAREREQLANSPQLAMLETRLLAHDHQCLKPDEPREKLRLDMLDAIRDIKRNPAPHGFEDAIQRLRAKLVGRTNKANWISDDALNLLTDVQDDVRKFAEKAELVKTSPEILHNAAQLACDVFAVAVRANEAYQAAKRDRPALDYDDLITHALLLLRTQPDTCRHVARGIRFLLVDEFQDTDSQQYELVGLLKNAHEDLRVFIVGDAKQSIYGFRGAEVEIFQHAQEDRQVIRLARNYRTVPEVLAFINHFFGATDLLSAVTPEYRPMTPHRPPCGQTRVEFLVPDDQGGQIKGADMLRGLEAELIADRIAAMCSDGSADRLGSGDESRPVRFGDIAILLRAFPKLHLYERALREHGVPYQVVAGKGFHQREEVYDVLNMLKLATDPMDEQALLGFLRGPAGGLSDESIARLLYSGGMSPQPLPAVFYSEDMPHEFPQALELARARKRVSLFRESSGLPLPVMLRRILDESGYESIALGQFLGLQKASNVRKLVDLADDFTRTQRPALSSFVRYLEEASVRELREGDATLSAMVSGAVTLMTIHKAKGLEFPVVVVADLARSPRPHDGSEVMIDRNMGLVAKARDDWGEWLEPEPYQLMVRMAKKREQHEDARLLYVAMTRAREWLLLGAAPNTPDGAWTNAFQQAYSIMDKPHDATLDVQGCQVRVIRQPRRIGHDAPADNADAQNVMDIQRRIGRLVLPSSNRWRFTVTDLVKTISTINRADNDDTPPCPGLITPAILSPLERGNLLHHLMERWDFRSDPCPLIEEQVRACPSFPARKFLRDYLRQCVDALKASELWPRLADSGTAVLHEQPFSLRIGDAIVNGTIDLMLADGTVVDYKTGQHDPSRHASYEWQIRLYAAAIRRLRHLACPAGYLFYIDLEKFEAVDVSEAMADEAVIRAEDAIAILRERPEQADNDEDEPDAGDVSS